MTAAHRRQGIASALRLLGPPVIWALHFSILYAAQTVFCSWMGQEMSVVAAVSASAVAVILLAIIIFKPLRAGAAGNATGFVERTGMALAWLSLCAVIWQTLPVFVVPSCVPPL